MTSFNEQFNKLVEMTLAERQHVNDHTDTNTNIQVVDETGKIEDFFQDHNPLGKKCTIT